MVFLVTYFCDEYFRFFDSGDIQGETDEHRLDDKARHVEEAVSETRTEGSAS